MYIFITNTTHFRMQPPREYPARDPHDNYTASCDIHSATPAFLRLTSDEAPSSRSSVREYNRNNSR